MKKIPLVGAHVSAAGGMHNAIANAEKIGADCMQIFGASPRQWEAKIPNEAQVALFKEAEKKSGVVRPVFLHASYLVNLASADEEQWNKSIASLTRHLQIVEAIEAQGLIFHMGTAGTLSLDEAMERSAAGMKAVLAAVPGKSQLIIENSAGGGGKLVKNCREIGHMIGAVNSPRVKICIDTAHTLESGQIEKYTPENIGKFFDELDREAGLENLVALHANDSKTPANSKSDRHENIGKGYIGLDGFKNLAKEKRLQGTCWLLEVPGFDGEGPDKKNVDILKSCIG